MPGSLTGRKVPLLLLLMAMMLAAGGFLHLIQNSDSGREKKTADDKTAQSELASSTHYADKSVVLPISWSRDGYVTSDECRSCHSAEFDSWHRSYHRTMTQAASPTAIIAPFDDFELSSRNRNYRFENRDGDFWVTMADPEWESAARLQGVDLQATNDPPQVSRRVVMTTGSHNMQGYWIAGNKGNELWQLPWYYLLDDKRWVPREDAFLSPPDGGRHLMMWNQNCIECHAVRGNPGLGSKQEWVAHSEVAELGIACEACHGPGKTHVATHKMNSAGLRSGADPTIVNPARLDAQAASEVCAQCHSGHSLINFQDFHRNGLDHQPGQPNRSIHYDTPADFAGGDAHAAYSNGFWPDHTGFVGGDEYQGMIASKCFEGGSFSCISCHSMHSSDPDKQLKHGRVSNRSCVNCHETIGKNVELHTHHSVSSSGSLCFNCHMPHTSYALLRGMRSHRIDSPSAALSARTGRPNACNQCHTDQTLQWTANQLTKWYGHPTPQLSEKHRSVSATVVWMLQGNALQRALAAWTLGWKPAQKASGADWQPPLLASMLDDPYSAVRYVAGKSLKQFSELEPYNYDYVAPSRIRRDIMRMILADSEGRRLSASSSKTVRLLFDKDGQLDQAAVEEFLKAQDDTPIHVPE